MQISLTYTYTCNYLDIIFKMTARMSITFAFDTSKQN